uniref:Uncharacterized protein n=1 Tax=Oryza meridionalis TaxID=40149 RepID=A0A0E0CKG7_9ORYZ
MCKEVGAMVHNGGTRESSDHVALPRPGKCLTARTDQYPTRAVTSIGGGCGDTQPRRWRSVVRQWREPWVPVENQRRWRHSGGSDGIAVVAMEWHWRLWPRRCHDAPPVVAMAARWWRGSNGWLGRGSRAAARGIGQGGGAAHGREGRKRRGWAGSAGLRLSWAGGLRKREWKGEEDGLNRGKFGPDE